jgi:hypothetical protein
MTTENTYIDGKFLPSIVEVQRRHRIRLSVFAYAYEFESESLISDGEYDRLSQMIDSNIKTGHKKLDKFFATEFEPDTGMWIRKHPELDKVRALHFMWKNNFDYARYLRIGAEVYDFQKKEMI